VRISRDLLRTANRERVFLRACVETRQPFVVDKVNATRADRATFVGPALAAGFRAVAYWLDVAPSDALARNAGRAGRARIPVQGSSARTSASSSPAATRGSRRSGASS